MKRALVFLFLCLILTFCSIIANAEESTKALISIEYLDSEIKSALNDLAYQARITIVVDDYVEGTVTLSLTDASVADAIDLICMKGGYGYKKLSDKLYVVGPIDPSNPTFQKHASTEVIQLNYIKAQDAMMLLPHFQKYMSAKDNVLIVRAWPNQIEDIKSDVRLLDKPVRQILGKVIIAEVTAEAKKRLGIGATDSTNGVSLDFGNSTLIETTLKALQVEGLANLGVATSIVVPEGSESTISIGKEVREIIYNSALNINSVERLQAKTYLTLGVQRITSNNEIMMTYEVAAEDLGEDIKSEMPTVLSRQAKGTVSVNNNSAFSIGGLSKNVYNRSSGSLPPSVNEASQDTELMILILPHIIGTPEPEQNTGTLVNRLKEEVGQKINETKTLRAKNDYTVSLGYGASIASLVQQMQTIEGQLNLSSHFGILAGTKYGDSSGEDYRFNYGGIVLRSLSKNRIAEIYAAAGFGQENISVNHIGTTSYKWFGRAGLNLKFLGNFFLGVGYEYIDADNSNNGFENNKSGCFARIGLTF